MFGVVAALLSDDDCASSFLSCLLRGSFLVRRINLQLGCKCLRGALDDVEVRGCTTTTGVAIAIEVEKDELDAAGDACRALICDRNSATSLRSPSEDERVIICGGATGAEPLAFSFLQLRYFLEHVGLICHYPDSEGENSRGSITIKYDYKRC